jgi:hypothetical protein
LENMILKRQNHGCNYLTDPAVWILQMRRCNKLYNRI